MLCFVLAALVGTPVYGDPPESVDTTPDGNSQSEQAQQPRAQGRKKSSKPARTFTPSESISADSAVSFPVDI